MLEPRFSFFLLALLALAGCARPAPPAVDARAQAVEQRKEAFLRELADCEGGQGEGPVVGGGGRYIGRFQFMPATVITYVRERDGRTLTTGEAVALAHDYSQAAALAKYVIFERDGISHWPACSRKLGLARQVAEIRAL